jgi:hypothetical protein
LAGLRTTAARVSRGAICFEQFQPFAAQTVFEIHETGNVAARPSERVDESSADRIGDLHKHDGQGAGDTLQRRHAQGATGQNDVRRKRDQFRRVSTITIDIVLAPAGVDPHIAAVGPAQLLQDLLERCDAGVTFWIVRGRVHEHTDPPHLLGLLRARGERPRRRTTENTEKRPSPHVRPCIWTRHRSGSNEYFDRA